MEPRTARPCVAAMFDNVIDPGGSQRRKTVVRLASDFDRHTADGYAHKSREQVYTRLSWSDMFVIVGSFSAALVLLNCRHQEGLRVEYL